MCRPDSAQGSRFTNSPPGLILEKSIRPAVTGMDLRQSQVDFPLGGPNWLSPPVATSSVGIGGKCVCRTQTCPLLPLFSGAVSLASEQPESRNLWKAGTEWPREKLAFVFQPQSPLPGMRAKLYGR